MINPGSAPLVIEGRCQHKTSNALKMTFSDGPGDPIAVAVQGAGDGKGAKAAVLFGFKNGGTGKHVITYADGSTIGVQSREAQPTLLTRGDGTEFATVQRGDSTTALDPAGRPILVFTADPVEDKTPDLFRVVISTPDGTQIGELTIIRKVAGWSAWRAAEGVAEFAIWWDHAGQALKVPILGTRLVLSRPVSAIERDLLLAASVDIAIGLRPYIASMN